MVGQQVHRTVANSTINWDGSTKGEGIEIAYASHSKPQGTLTNHRVIHYCFHLSQQGCGSQRFRREKK